LARLYQPLPADPQALQFRKRFSFARQPARSLSAIFDFLTLAAAQIRVSASGHDSCHGQWLRRHTTGRDGRLVILGLYAKSVVTKQAH
jgi:hypothetical protein